MRSSLRSRQRGFTIIELMIATSVFSTVLIVVTAGVIVFTKQYYRGIVTNSTQNVARTAVNEISQAIQFGLGGSPEITSGGTVVGYCVNNKPYYFVLGKQLNGSGATTKTAHALVAADPGSSCSLAPNLISGSLPAELTNPRELLGKNMRLTSFSITPSGSNMYTVHLKVAYGDDDLLCNTAVEATGHANACADSTVAMEDVDYTDNDATGGLVKCRSTAGSQFCATAELTTTVAERL